MLGCTVEGGPFESIDHLHKFGCFKGAGERGEPDHVDEAHGESNLGPLRLIELTGALLEPSAAPDALEPLVEPVAFLLAAAPLAVLLDRFGSFTDAAALLYRTKRLPLGLWVFGAAVTTLLNLDAAVVLLTPLYVRIADRHGYDRLALAYQSALLASLASSALPSPTSPT